MSDSLDLTILTAGNPAEVIAVARYGFDLAIESLSCECLQDLMSFRDKLDDAASGKERRPTSQELIDFGRSLSDFTLKGRIAEIYGQLPPESHIRIQIYSNHADVQALPWEYFKHRDVPSPDVNRSVVRIIPTIGRQAPSAKKKHEPIRLLLVYADPIDQGFVDFPKVKRTIEDDYGAYLPEGLELDVVSCATRESLAIALEDKDYDIFHFVGHGEIGKDDKGNVLLRDARSGKTDSVTAERFGALLQARGIRLVILSSCSTASGDFSKQYAVLAQTLLESGIPAVVANQFPITNSLAASFSGAFYRALRRVDDVDQAVSRARQFVAFNIPNQGDAAVFEWGIPTLYRRVGAVRVFS